MKSIYDINLNKKTVVTIMLVAAVFFAIFFLVSIYFIVKQGRANEIEREQLRLERLMPCPKLTVDTALVYIMVSQMILNELKKDTELMSKLGDVKSKDLSKYNKFTTLYFNINCLSKTDRTLLTKVTKQAIIEASGKIDLSFQDIALENDNILLIKN